MAAPFRHRIFVLVLFLFVFNETFSQTTYGLRDGRMDPQCAPLIKSIQERSREVLFGISIQKNGDIFFSITNKKGYDQIFNAPLHGIAIDLVEKSRYDCNKPAPVAISLIRGHLTRPVYKAALDQELKLQQDGSVFIKVGQVPAELLNKEIEGNLVIVKSELIAFYTNFVNIDRAVWELLPMGLYSDTLLQTNSAFDENNKEFFTYTRMARIVVPFPKGKTTYNANDIKPLYDSLKMKDYIIRKIDIRAFSSVEGPESLNKQLMQGRADAMIKALKQFGVSMERSKTLTLENWVEFYQDIKNTTYKNLASLSKFEVKQQLADKEFIKGVEPILSNHRKAIVTIYMEPKTEASTIQDNAIKRAFQDAVQAKEINRARSILKEIVQRIQDNRAPNDFLNELEIPQEKPYATILNDREVYQYMLHNIDEYTALDEFMKLKKIDSTNARINYNICTLKFAIWKYDADSINANLLLNEINALPRYGIANPLVLRMQINYQILKCRDFMRKGAYAEKDQSLEFIRRNYPGLNLTDEEIYSLAKYFAFYAHFEWAEEIVNARVDKIDVSEDIVFYYLNLGFYHHDLYPTDKFQKAMLNAINLNRTRFCNFFKSINNGGAGMQLLEHAIFKQAWCENCAIDRMLGKN